MDATYWRERIASELSALDQHELVIIEEPGHEPPAAGLLRRMRTKVHRPAEPSRWGQVLCVDEVLFAEFTGTTRIGGTWPASQEQHEGLREAGWLTPDETDPIAPAPRARHYWRTVPQPECALVSEMLVDAFTILDADLDTLRVRHGG